MQQVTGSSDTTVILLTDEARQRVISVMCDEATALQFSIRVGNGYSHTLLPEALLQVCGSQLEMMIFGLFEGQYQVVLMNMDTGVTTRLRMCDAILLSIISETPLYIEERLMQQQSVPFDENSQRIAIPINTMDIQSLQSALAKAVDDEDYKLASHIRDEINSRKKEK